MKNTLKYGVLAIAHFAPITAFAEMGDPSPNSWGIGGVNVSAEQPGRLPGARVRGTPGMVVCSRSGLFALAASQAPLREVGRRWDA